MDLTALRGRLRDIVAPCIPTQEGFDERADAVGMVQVSQDPSDLEQTHTDLARRVDQQAALAKLSHLAVDTHDVNAFLDRVIELITDTLEVDWVEILKCDSSDGDLLLRRPCRAEASSQLAHAPAANSLEALALETGTSQVAEDLDNDEQAGADPCLEGPRSCVVSPIGNGNAWGVLTVHSRLTRRFGKEDVYFVESVANLIASVIDRAKADQHRNRLAEILETTTDFVGTADPSGRVTYANRAARAAAGFDDQEDIVGLGIDSFQPAWAVDIMVTEAFPTALAEGIWSGRTAFLDPLKGEVPTSQVIIAHGTPDGGDAFLSTVARDLTKTLEAERRLGESQALVGKAFHDATVGKAVLDLEGRYVTVNRALAHFLGYEPDELTGRSFREFTHPDDLQLGQDEMDQMRSGELDSFHVQKRYVRADDSTVWGMLHVSLMPGETGHPNYQFAQIIDIDSQKEAEAVAQRQGEIAQSVLRSVRFPVAVLDGKGVIAAVNQAWSRFAHENGGTTDATGVGADYLEVCSRAGDDPYAMAAVRGIQRVLSGEIAEYALDYPCLEPNGTERWFELEVTPIEDEGAVVTHWDITDELKARSALEETIRAKDQFIATLSHELRTPLTAIVGMTQLIREGDYGETERSEFQETIAEQAQEMALLVEDLLVAARLDSDTLSFKPKRVNLAAEIARVLAPWRTQRLLEIEVNSPESLFVACDPVRLRQIIRNLVTNSIRHGQEPFEIEVTRRQACATVTVADHGPGVPEHALDMMFQPYAAFADGSAQPSSVGLGLHVSLGLAKRMGGDLTYRREEGRTVFELRVPAGLSEP